MPACVIVTLSNDNIICYSHSTALNIFSKCTNDKIVDNQQSVSSTIARGTLPH